MTSAPNVMQRGLRADFVSRLRGIAGDKFLVSSFEFREGNTASPADSKLETRNSTLLPDLSVAPACADEVAAILRICTEEKIAVVPVGSALQQQIGIAPQRPFIAISTSRLKEVDHYDPGDLTIGVGAGTTLREVDAMVRPHQQWLPVLASPERVTLGSASIGGVLATGMHGPLKHAHGGVREFCIGIRFVTGDGTRGKGGGRVVKNVAGYDLMKLLIGSYGTLAVITSASFKLFPRPRQTATFVCRFAGAAEAIAFRDRVVNSPLAPLTLEIVSPYAAAILHEQHHDSQDGNSLWRVLVRAAGTDRQLARYRAELGEAISAELAGEDEAAAWGLIEDFEAKRPPGAIVLAVSAPISDVALALATAQRVAGERGIQFASVGRAGVGSLVAAFLGANEAISSAVHALRAALPPQVVVNVKRCPSEMKATIPQWQVRSEELEIMRTLKNAMDTAWILNRGRYFV